jgi:hypothetical protein
MGGEWRLTVSVRRDGKLLASREFFVQVEE